MLANGPTVRVVDKKDVREVLTSAMGQSSPGEPTIVSSQHQTIGAGSPS